MAEKIPIRQIRETAMEPNLTGSFSIRKIQDVLAGNEMNEPLHRHEFFLILAIESGFGKHEIDFIDYQVTDNSVFLLRPGQVHRLSLQADSAGYIVQFKGDFFSQSQSGKELLRKVSHIKTCRISQAGFGKLSAILNYVFNEYTDKLEGYEEVIKSNLSIFFTELVRNRQNRENAAASSNSYAQDKLEKFYDLMDSHITDSRQVSFYADKLNLSVYQLSSVTKSLLGKTPSDLINEHVILESKRQLLATTNQVNQIAYSLGYDDVSYFIRFFKKHTGHSPDAFRNISKLSHST